MSVAVAVVAFFVWRSHPGEIASHIRHANAGWLAAALVLNLPIFILAPLRSVLVLRRLDRRVSFRHLVPATVVGYIAGSFTPAASGDLLRAGALRATAGIELDRGIALILYERIVSTYLLGASVLTWIALRDLPAAGRVIALISFALALFLPWAGGRFLLIHLPRPEGIAGSGRIAAIGRKLLAMAANVRFLLIDLPLLRSPWSAMTLAIFAVIALQLLFLARSSALI